MAVNTRNTGAHVTISYYLPGAAYIPPCTSETEPHPCIATCRQDSILSGSQGPSCQRAPWGWRARCEDGVPRGHSEVSGRVLRDCSSGKTCLWSDSCGLAGAKKAEVPVTLWDLPACLRSRTSDPRNCGWCHTQATLGTRRAVPGGGRGRVSAGSRAGVRPRPVDCVGPGFLYIKGRHRPCS